MSNDDAVTNDGVLHLDREIRVPTSISEQAQASLRAAVPVVHATLANPVAAPPLDDKDAWRARERDGRRAHRVDVRRSRTPG